MDGSTEITTHVDAPPARVWAALTDADALAAWYRPASLRPAVVSDPRAGGRFAVTAQAAETGSTAPGRGSRRSARPAAPAAR